MKRKGFGLVRPALVALGLMISTQASAANHIGTINWIELWSNGNVAFTLNGTSPACTPAHFILNVSSPGTKNRYALLLALKAQGTTVTIVSSGCGPAEGYSPSAQYAIVDYMYYY